MTNPLQAASESPILEAHIGLILECSLRIRMNSRLLSLIAVVLLVSSPALSRESGAKQRPTKPDQAKQKQLNEELRKAPGQESPVQLKTQLVEVRAVVTNK